MESMHPLDDLIAGLEGPEQRLSDELLAQDRKLMAELIKFRRSREITQGQIAERLDVTQATIAAFERRGNDPKLSTLRRYAAAVGALVEHRVRDPLHESVSPTAWLASVVIPLEEVVDESDVDEGRDNVTIQFSTVGKA